MRSSGLALDAPAALRCNACRCCIAPLSFAAELATRRLHEPQLPQRVGCLETGRLAIDLTASELGRLAAAMSHLANFEAFEQHRRFRPPATTRPLDNPRAWWVYAAGAIRWQRQQMREPYTWASVMRRGKQRRAFVRLHKKLTLRGGALERLSESERVSYAQLCEALPASEQVLFERIAAAQLRYEMPHSEPEEEGGGAEGLSRLFGLGGAPPTARRHSSSALADHELHMSAEQRSETRSASPAPSLANARSRTVGREPSPRATSRWRQQHALLTRAFSCAAAGG